MAPAGLEVRFLETSGSRGPTDKRNLGWRASSARLVAFTDDDCRPHPEWLERLLAATADDRFLQGRTEPDPDERHLLRGLARSRTVVGESPWYPGCNVAYPRAVLERLGGFDESFIFGSEDTDLAIRATEEGVACRYVDDALVWHAVLPRSVLSALEDVTAWPTFPLLFEKHPRYRRHLYLGVFRNKAHATLCLGLVGSAVFRERRWLAAASWLPYAAEQFGGNVTPGRRNLRALTRLAIHVPGRMLVDLADVASTVRSAAAHRVLLI